MGISEISKLDGRQTYIYIGKEGLKIKELKRWDKYHLRTMSYSESPSFEQTCKGLTKNNFYFSSDILQHFSFVMIVSPIILRRHELHGRIRIFTGFF